MKMHGVFYLPEEVSCVPDEGGRSQQYFLGRPSLLPKDRSSFALGRLDGKVGSIIIRRLGETRFK